MMKHATLIVLGVSMACLAGCAHEPAASPVAQTDAHGAESRLRMFGQNGSSALLFRGGSCVKSMWSKDAEIVSGSLGSAFSSFAGTASNTRLGIAETDTTRNLSGKNQLLSKAYFREYVVPAGKPSSMRIGFRNPSSFYVANGMRHEYGGASCKGAISFTPRSGEDYEVAFAWEGNTCTLSVNQVRVNDGQTELTPVPVAPAPDC
jgi:hypothetical protein